MKIILPFLCFFSFLAFAQEKKKDSADTELKNYQYKARIYYPFDCSCPDKIIYKELKKGDKDFNPYHYKYQNPVRMDSLNKEDKKKSLEMIYRKV